ncbi:MAG: cysteine desulfurase [Bacteroidetes bacterium]|uniref:Probable cysteine desulfurase n=1 Tax=Candidatus Gallipaludibacter merdavium TaxID=2840839 RepID=A0A9D9HUQ8_9BACT|nr:cysteine desulfurase [Candidatus Gallipaludibacter merdavium]
MKDFSQYREDFPLLKIKVYDKPLIYLDNGATTQKPQCVLDKLNEIYTLYNANIHRGVHHLSQIATMAHENARKTVADFIHAKSSAEITFTRGTTESINLTAFCFGERYVNEGDEIIVSHMEHHSNIVPWQLMCERKRATLKVIPITPDGELDMNAYKNMLNEKTRIVAVTHVSNVLGTVNPIKEIIHWAHLNGTPVLVDGAQSIPHLPVDVQDLDADFYAFSGHKIYAPTGIGVLYGKAKWLEEMPPYQGGGEMIEHVSFEKTTFNELPYKYEAGTPNYEGSIALAEALRYVSAIGMEQIAQHEQELIQYAMEQMASIPNLRFIGMPKHRSGVISFLIGNEHPYDVGMLLDKLGVAVRTGHHCAQPLVEYYNIPGTVRASFALYNNKEDIDQFVLALNRVANMLL